MYPILNPVDSSPPVVYRRRSDPGELKLEAHHQLPGTLRERIGIKVQTRRCVDVAEPRTRETLGISSLGGQWISRRRTRQDCPVEHVEKLHADRQADTLLHRELPA